MIVIDTVKTTHIIVIDTGIMTEIEATVEITHKTTIDLTPHKDITTNLKVHTHLDLDITITIKEELHPDLHIDHHIGTTLVTDTIHDQDIDPAHNHKEISLEGTITHIDLLPNQEITDHDPEHFHRTDNKIE